MSRNLLSGDDLFLVCPISAKKKKERDSDLVNAEIALKRAARRAREQAKKAGIGVIVLRNGRIIEELPDKEL